MNASRAFMKPVILILLDRPKRPRRFYSYSPCGLEKTAVAISKTAVLGQTAILTWSPCCSSTRRSWPKEKKQARGTVFAQVRYFLYLESAANEKPFLETVDKRHILSSVL